MSKLRVRRNLVITLVVALLLLLGYGATGGFRGAGLGEGGDSQDPEQNPASGSRTPNNPNSETPEAGRVGDGDGTARPLVSDGGNGDSNSGSVGYRAGTNPGDSQRQPSDASVWPEGMGPDELKITKPTPESVVQRLSSDSIETYLSFAEEAATQGKPASGFLALQPLAAQGEADVDQARVLAVKQRLTEQLQEAIELALADVDAGRVLAARGRLESLCRPPTRAVEEFFGAAAKARDFPAPPSGFATEVADGTPQLGMPKVNGEVPPFAPHRIVRIRHEGKITQARVTGGKGAFVTAKLETRRGATYPRVLRTNVEPVDATPAEAAAQGLVAWGAGDRALSWLWLCQAIVASGGELKATEALRLNRLLRSH